MANNFFILFSFLAVNEISICLDKLEWRWKFDFSYCNVKFEIVCCVINSIKNQNLSTETIPKESNLNIVKIAKFLKNFSLLFESIFMAMNNFLSKII